MIVIDTSAFVAILTGEPEAEEMVRALAAAPARAMSAATYVECAILATARFGDRAMLDRFLADFEIDIVPVDASQARLAADAFVMFGKGRHPAGLNYGDCFAYALARGLGAPPLFKGEDFSRTDLTGTP